MKLCFDTVDELREFVKNDLKGKRGAGKGESEVGDTTGGNAPAPMQPPAQSFQPGPPQAFAPPVAGAAPQAGGFPAAAAPQPDPLVGQIIQRLDGALASGQNADQALTWFRNECVRGGVAEAANMTLDQIKQVALPKLPQPALQAIGKQMGIA